MKQILCRKVGSKSKKKRTLCLNPSPPFWYINQNNLTETSHRLSVFGYFENCNARQRRDTGKQINQHILSYNLNYRNEIAVKFMAYKEVVT